MTDELVTYRGSVASWHCDHNGHMNVMWYTGKFDEATWCFFATLGLTPSSLRREERGMVAVEQLIRYERELLAGDVVYVRTRPLEVRDKVLRFRHEMVNAETRELAASADLTGVHIDRRSRRSTPLPEAVVVHARALLAESA
jgi:acyl-CoA thioester hydrolase